MNITTTHSITIVGLACIFAGGSWGNWRFLKMTFPQLYQEARAGRLPTQTHTRWRTALVWVGFGLLVLSQWRACSGV